jgi:hypothetical protein
VRAWVGWAWARGAHLEDLEGAIVAEPEREGRGRLDAGHGGVGVRVQHGGEAEQQKREEAGDQQGDESCQVGRGHRSRSRRSARGSRRVQWTSSATSMPKPNRTNRRVHVACCFFQVQSSYCLEWFQSTASTAASLSSPVRQLQWLPCPLRIKEGYRQFDVYYVTL